MVEPVGQRAGAVEREALVQHVEGHVLKAVIVQGHLVEQRHFIKKASTKNHIGNRKSEKYCFYILCEV